MKAGCILIILLLTTVGYSQEVAPIQTDRPDQTETAAIVPAGLFQIETGFSYQRESSNEKSFGLPSILWKYGVNENFELRVITEFNYEKLKQGTQSGFAPVLLGFKTKLANEKGIIPQTSFIAHVGLPNVSSKNYKTEFFAPQFRFAMLHTLSNKATFSYNLGAEWDGFSPEPVFIYSSSFGFALSDKMGSYIELFGFIPQVLKSNHSIDGGITYLINNNFMVDLSSGIGISKNAPKYYWAIGFSFRI